MNKIFPVILLCILVSGCVDTQPTPIVTVPSVRIVKVPVYKPIPEPPVINKPNLAINSLTESSSQSDKIKALELTNSQLITYANKLKSALYAYKREK